MNVQVLPQIASLGHQTWAGGKQSERSSSSTWFNLEYPSFWASFITKPWSRLVHFSVPPTSTWKKHVEEFVLEKNHPTWSIFLHLCFFFCVFKDVFFFWDDRAEHFEDVSWSLSNNRSRSWVMLSVQNGHLSTCMIGALWSSTPCTLVRFDLKFWHWLIEGLPFESANNTSNYIELQCFSLSAFMEVT